MASVLGHCQASNEQDAEPGEPPVRVLTAVVQDDVSSVARRYPARVRAIEQVEIVSRLSADIVDVVFQEGSTVKEGQLLYRLDTVRFDAAVSNQQARIADVEAKLRLANQTFSRKSALLAKEMAPRADFDAAQAEKASLEAQLAAERAALALAEDDLRHTRITAPISGRIGLTAKTVGNYVTPESGVLARIVRTDPLRVRFSLSLTDYARFFGGDEKRLKTEADIRVLTAEGLPELPKAQVEFADIQAVERTDTVFVYARQPNAEGRLVPDAAVTLVMCVRTGTRRPWVPPQAVLDDGETTQVYVVEEGHAVLRQVTVEAELPDRVYISGGLKVGETVIVGGVHKVSDGAAVEGRETLE